MSRVATCPQCSHEILILDDGNQDAWAKCPECRAFFQIREAAGREIHPAISIGEQSAAPGGETAIADDTMLETFSDKMGVSPSRLSDADITESHADFAEEDTEAEQATEVVSMSDEPTEVLTTNEPAESVQSNESADMISGLSRPTMRIVRTPVKDENISASSPATAESQATPQTADPIEESSDRIDKWFRKTKSEVDASPPAVDEQQEKATDLGDVEIEQPEASSGSEPTWDDTEHMDQLLGDVDHPTPQDATNQQETSGEVETADRTENLPEGSSEDQGSTEPPQLIIPPGQFPRRKKSLGRKIVASAVSGIVGLTLGYFALLWILGPTGDFLNVAQHLPAIVLPAEFHDELARIPVDSPRTQPPADARADRDQDNAAPDAADQASFTTSLESSDNGRAADQDQSTVTTDSSPSGGGDPLPFDDSSATPMTPANAGDGQIANAPSFTADELAVAFQNANEAQPKLVTGRLDDGREVQRAKGFAYSILCDLAQKFAFVDTMRADYVAALAADVERLFKQTLADPQTRDEVARIVPKWIASPHRKHGGVFFAGIVAQSDQKGAVLECQFQLGANETAVVLIQPEQADRLNSLAPLGIVGWIVEAPAEKVSGYTGDATQAIWAVRVFHLE